MTFRAFADLMIVKLGRRAFDQDDAAVPAEIPEDLVKAIIAVSRRERS